MTSPLSERAYKSIKQDIITCTLEAGEQIIQSQLADRYRIGTTPIREALQRLVQDGFVQSIPRYGYIVSRVSLSDVHEIYECRQVLEPALAYLAATRATEAQLAEIKRTAHFDYSYNKDNSSEAHVHNAEFHRAIAVASGNGRLYDQISRVLDEMTRIFFLGIDLSGSADALNNNHLKLAEALHARDANLAKQIMKDELLYSKQAVLDALMRRLATPEHAMQL